MHYAAILANRPSGISQAVAIAVHRTQGVNNKNNIYKLFGKPIVFQCLLCFQKVFKSI